VKKPPDVERPPARPAGSIPEIVVTYKPAGRETLDAIASELVPLPLPAEPQSSSPLPERQSSSPEIIVHEAPLDPLAALAREQAEARAATARQAAPPRAEPPAAPVPPAAIVSLEATPASTTSTAQPDTRAGTQSLEIFEMVTYVVRGGDVARLSSESARRAFVEEHLLARLPVRTMAEIERIDMTPWTVQGTLVVRVWCRTIAGAESRRAP
jgi:hypothetical protein